MLSFVLGGKLPISYFISCILLSVGFCEMAGGHVSIVLEAREILA
jgi:hypothetical protein